MPGLTNSPQSQPRSRYGLVIWFASLIFFAGLFWVFKDRGIGDIKKAIEELLEPDGLPSQPVGNLAVLTVSLLGTAVSAIGTVCTMIIAIRRDRREVRAERKTNSKKRPSKR